MTIPNFFLFFFKFFTLEDVLYKPNILPDFNTILGATGVVLTKLMFNLCIILMYQDNTLNIDGFT